ncbi:sugar kinase [Ferruginibacter paludis]|uniref:sugar kinase n=1 Tax=Ferruginibacter paludis TaxID=1310417 RepID=UPI0025B2BD54|nr:sugar kinase [Ferruginibacter paludis]MDN3655431.1 sugar kinase [Ferruginibacter paludis]
MKKKVLCFGELLMRFSPVLEGEWIRQQSIPVFIGGAELNAANALALWDIPVKYCTALPDNYLSRDIMASLNTNKIDTSSIQFAGNRIGGYYLPQGADLKNAGVIYDRAHSSFAELKTGMIDWDKVLDDVEWFHFSAICPALSADVALVCKEALEACAGKKILISVDLNYRSKLWQFGKQPIEIMPSLVQYCHLVMGNIWAAETMLGIGFEEDVATINQQENYLRQSNITSQKILQQYPVCKSVANTFRFGDEALKYYTTLYHQQQLYVSSTYSTSFIKDKVGSGDCFMAGLIYGFYNGLPPQQTVAYATAAAFQKLFITGDATNKTAAEVNAFIPTHD